MGSGGSHSLWSSGENGWNHADSDRLRAWRWPRLRPARRIRVVRNAQTPWGYMVKPHGPLVSVSSTPRSASTPDLSTSWSRWALQEAQGLGDVSS